MPFRDFRNVLNMEHLGSSHRTEHCAVLFEVNPRYIRVFCCLLIKTNIYDVESTLLANTRYRGKW